MVVIESNYSTLPYIISGILIIHLFDLDAVGDTVLKSFNTVNFMTCKIFTEQTYLSTKMKMA